MTIESHQEAATYPSTSRRAEAPSRALREGWLVALLAVLLVVQVALAVAIWRTSASIPASAQLQMLRCEDALARRQAVEAAMLTGQGARGDIVPLRGESGNDVKQYCHLGDESR